MAKPAHVDHSSAQAIKPLWRCGFLPGHAQKHLRSSMSRIKVFTYKGNHHLQLNQSWYNKFVSTEH